MKRRFALLPALAAVVLTAGAASAQQDGPRPDRPMGFARNPVAILVDSAQTLGLSSDQTTRLQAIARELDTRNRPALDSLERYRPQGGGGMGGGMGGEMTPEMRARMDRMRPIMQQLREGNREAVAKAMEVLTPEQRERAQPMLPRMGRGGPGGPGGQGGPPPQP